MNKKLVILSIAVNFLIFVLEAVFATNSFLGYMGSGYGLNAIGWTGFTYFTNDSNVFLGFVCLLLGILELVGLLKKKPTPRCAIILKMTATMTVMVTFIIAWTVLLPIYGGVSFVLGPYSLLWLHTVCPLLALGSFLFLDDKALIKKTDGIYGAIPMLTYAIPILILIGLDLIKAPYPFLEIYSNPWYLSVVYFTLIIGGAIGFCFLLTWLYSLIRKKLYRLA